MKILFFTHNYLDNKSGGSFATCAYVNAFCELANSCKLIYPERGIPIAIFINKKCIIEGVQDKRSNVQKVIDIYRGRIHRYTDIMIPRIQEYNPDIVVFDNSFTSAGLLKEIKKTGLNVITIHQNYEIEYFKGTRPFIAWRFPFLHYIKEAERLAVLYSDLNLTLTNEDISLLQIHYDPQKTRKIVKLGTFEYVNDSLVINNEAGNNKTYKRDLCFAITGSLGSQQTEASLIPFLKYQYPMLLKILPESKLIIAGRNPSTNLVDFCAEHPTIKLIRNPQNMQEVLNNADVYICPTCVGGGLKLRIMDGLKAGLPVLTHIVSARGYDDFQKAGYLFTYKDRYSFEKSLEQLLSERRKGRLNKPEIQHLYNSIFSFNSGVERLRKILNTYFESEVDLLSITGT